MRSARKQLLTPKALAAAVTDGMCLREWLMVASFVAWSQRISRGAFLEDATIVVVLDARPSFFSTLRELQHGEVDGARGGAFQAALLPCSRRRGCHAGAPRRAAWLGAIRQQLFPFR